MCIGLVWIQYPGQPFIYSSKLRRDMFYHPHPCRRKFLGCKMPRPFEF
jgi:hypothetical protein